MPQSSPMSENFAPSCIGRWSKTTLSKLRLGTNEALPSWAFYCGTHFSCTSNHWDLSVEFKFGSSWLTQTFTVKDKACLVWKYASLTGDHQQFGTACAARGSQATPQPHFDSCATRWPSPMLPAAHIFVVLRSAFWNVLLLCTRPL